MPLLALRPSERLTALALLALSAATAASGPVGGGARLVVFSATLAVVLLLSRVGASGALGLVRDFAPVGVVVLVYFLLQPVIEAVNPARWDERLAALDARWFSAAVVVWRSALGRPAALTDVVYLAYVSYYLLPVAVAVGARWRRGPVVFEATVFTMLLGFYLSFLGYFLFPASGPRVPDAEQGILGGGAVSEAVRAFLRGAEATTLDAFPSGHTTLAIVPAVLGMRLAPRAGLVLWPWAGALIFATVYISVHYAVDVVAGVFLAVVVLAVAPGLARRLGGGWSGEVGRPPGA